MRIKEISKSIDMYLGYSNLLDDNHKVIFLSESESNINFLIDAVDQKYLFRLNKSSKLGLRNQIRYEHDVLKTLEKSHVTPKTFLLDDSATFFEYGALIMQYIEGRPLEYQKDMYEAAKILATIHSLDTEKINISHFIKQTNIIEDSLEKSRLYLDNVFKSAKVDIKLKLKLSELLEWAEKNQACKSFFEKDTWNTINNTEAHAKNFIISERKRKGYLVDWEQAVISDPSVDIAYFLSPISTMENGNYIFSQDEIDYFYKTYIMYLDRYDRDIIERVRTYTPYLYLKSLSEITNRFIVTENQDLKTIINMEFIEKLTKNIL